MKFDKYAAAALHERITEAAADTLAAYTHDKSTVLLPPITVDALLNILAEHIRMHNCNFYLQLSTSCCK